MHNCRNFILLMSILILIGAVSAEDERLIRVQRHEVVPLAGHQVSLRAGGVEKTRWHFGGVYPRPYLFPFNGPAGASLTRMGHPGAPNHDHHRSVWFAHHDVNGIDFWSDNTNARIVQTNWLAYVDGEQEAIMASQLEWRDGDGKAVMQQELIAALMAMSEGEHALEIQITLRPPQGGDSVQLGKTNFGLLAVRVAKSVSVHFGAGTITDSEGRVGEKEIFGKRARWMDYCGPVAVGTGNDRNSVIEGITYFDHPDNPRYPTHWHVREDGWMGASLNMHDPYTIREESPLILRYLLHAHRSKYNAKRALDVHTQFANRPRFEVRKSTKPHRQFEVRRKIDEVPPEGVEPPPT